MSDLRAVLGAAAGAAFAGLGLDAALGRVTASDRPDLADFQCNGALAAARAAKRDPREIAAAVAAALRAHPAVAEAGVAGPGFVNLRVAGAALATRANALLDDPRSGAGQRRSAPAGAGRLCRAQCRQGDARRPPARLDHRRGDQAAVSVSWRRGGGRRPFRRLGFPDGPAAHRLRRGGSGDRRPARAAGHAPERVFRGGRGGDRRRSRRPHLARRPRPAVSGRRRAGQGRPRLSRPRPSGDGRAAGRAVRPPAGLAAFRARSPASPSSATSTPWASISTCGAARATSIR